MLEGPRKFLKVVIIAVIALLVLAAGAFAGYKYKEFQADNERKDLQLKYLQELNDAKKSEDQDTNGQNTDISNPNDDQQDNTPKSTVFVGKYLKVTLPANWSVVEYENGNGSSMLSQGDPYSGLTGVYINNPSAITVFKIQAVNGIGGTDQCSEYAKFSDFNQSDYNTKNTYNITNFGTPITLLDLTGQTYSSLAFLGVTGRRVGEDFYWDKVTGNNTFESACGMDLAFPPLKGISFSQGGTSMKTYSVTFTQGTSAAELLELDGILNTLAVK